MVGQVTSLRTGSLGRLVEMKLTDFESHLAVNGYGLIIGRHGDGTE